MHAASEPDPEQVAADDELVEDLRAGAQPPTEDQVAQYLAAWRDDVREPDLPDPEPIYRQLADELLLDIPHVPDGPVEYGGYRDWPGPQRRSPMQYRRDVPAYDAPAIAAEIEHVRAHLSSVCDPNDDEDARANEVHVQVGPHLDGDPALVSVVGEIDAEPDAPYLRDGYDPASEEPVEFTPYEEPELDRQHDAAALAAFREGHA